MSENNKQNNNEEELENHLTTTQEILNLFKDDDRKLFLANLEKKKYNAGETLVRKGEPQTAVYLIEEGEIIKIKSEGSKTTLKSGDVAGLHHFYAQDPSAATLEVGKDGATVSTMTAKKFQELIESNPSLIKPYVTFLHRKVRKTLNAIGSVRSQMAGGGAKIAFFDTKPYMKSVFVKVNEEKNYKFKFTWFEVRLSKQTAQLAAGHEIVCIFVNDKLDEEVAQTFVEMGVKMLALRCAGFDNIDLDALKKGKISVTRVPAYSPYAVAEFAVGHMLCLNRKFQKAYNRVRENNFELNNLVGFDMHGKTVGIFGTGKIGVCTANILLGFGCKLIAVDVNENKELIQKGVKYVTKDELLQQSDIITIHAPLLPSTKHWLDKEALTKVKKGVMIINTSRGPLVETEALLDALLDGRVGSVGLDVVEGEAKVFFENHETEQIQDSTIARLIASPNVLLTSHQAFLTQEALHAIAESTLGSIKEFLDGKSGDDLTNAIKAEK